jgi:hypothetical protein
VTSRESTGVLPAQVCSMRNEKTAPEGGLFQNEVEKAFCPVAKLPSWTTGRCVPQP